MGFKGFAFKGNLVNTTVGIAIRGPFGTVVKSLVDNILMLIIGRISDGVSFSDKFFVLKEELPEGALLENASKIDEVNVLTYGNFITAFISFLTLAFVLFLVIKKFMGALQKAEEEPAPSKEVVLLTDIRNAPKN
ncbi:large conductance mechanosensitive channel protein MscL [Verrucomicrobiales bacterium]|nr:large conductance mechanosensitive channel protein MscL [Verrucomicrobiales bacterium]